MPVNELLDPVAPDRCCVTACKQLNVKQSAQHAVVDTLSLRPEPSVVLGPLIVIDQIVHGPARSGGFLERLPLAGLLPPRGS